MFEALRGIRPGICGQDEADASMAMVLWVAYLFAGTGCVEWSVTMTLGLFSVQAPWELDICVLCDSPFDIFTNSTLFILGEQSPRDVLWKPFLFVWIADRHIQNGFSEPFILFFGIRFNEQRHPSLKADRGEAWNVWSLTVSFLDEVVLTFKVSIHSGN